MKNGKNDLYTSLDVQETATDYFDLDNFVNTIEYEQKYYNEEEYEDGE